MSADTISDDEAVAFLMDVPEAAPEPGAPEALAPVAEPESQSEAVPTAEDIEAPEQPASQDAPPAPVEAAPQPSIDPPHFWDAQSKARFAQLPPDLQIVVADQAKNGERAVTKAQQEAAEVRPRAATEATRLADLNQRLGETVTDKKAEFNKRWEPLSGNGNAGWLQLSRENPDQYTQALAMFNAENAEMQRLDAVKQEADRAATQAEAQRQQAWATSEGEKLKTLAPDLTDPKEGRGRVERLAAFGATLGVAPDQFRMADALTLSLAYDAMRYRELMAKARTPAARAAPAPATPQSRPASAPAASPKTAADTLLAKGKAAGRLSDADALALLLAP